MINKYISNITKYSYQLIKINIINEYANDHVNFAGRRTHVHNVFIYIGV